VRLCKILWYSKHMIHYILTIKWKRSCHVHNGKNVGASFVKKAVQDTVVSEARGKASLMCKTHGVRSTR
jgi:hypothetical protein